MTTTTRLRIARFRVRQFAAPVISAATLYGGFYQIIATLKYPLTDSVLRFINAIIRQGFRDRLPLIDYYGGPWHVQVRNITIGIVVIVIGIFFSLWTHVRSQRKPT